jgi:hypothetical protein
VGRRALTSTNWVTQTTIVGEFGEAAVEVPVTNANGAVVYRLIQVNAP